MMSKLGARFTALATLALGLGGTAASVPAQVLTVCVSQNPVAPLTYPDREGDAQLMVRAAASQLGRQVSFATAPWLRCRMGLKAGTYHAILPIIGSTDYLADYAFPMRNGSVDTGRSVGPMTVAVVRRIGQGVSWDGTAFTDLRGPVLVLPGQMIARDKLKSLGVTEDAGTPLMDSMLRKLVIGRGDAAILPLGAAEAALGLEEFRGKLEILPIALTTEPSYISFNREFYEANTRWVEALWSGVARERVALAARGPAETVTAQRDAPPPSLRH